MSEIHEQFKEEFQALLDKYEARVTVYQQYKDFAETSACIDSPIFNSIIDITNMEGTTNDQA